MREIKFRAWDKEENKMISGDNFAFEEYAPLNDLFHNNSKKIDFMQYTGIKDYDGKEIYEGDIVEKEIMESLFDDSKLIGVVEMIEGCWCIENTKKRVAKGLWSETDINRVIGNIYENPELLEK